VTLQLQLRLTPQTRISGLQQSQISDNAWLATIGIFFCVNCQKRKDIILFLTGSCWLLATFATVKHFHFAVEDLKFTLYCTLTTNRWSVGWVDIGPIAQEYSRDLFIFMKKYGKQQK
jgi:hypothetical protein